MLGLGASSVSTGEFTIPKSSGYAGRVHFVMLRLVDANVCCT